MQVKEELKKIELMVMEKTKEAIDFLKGLYPLNDRYFMTNDENKKIDSIKNEVEALYKQYLDIFWSIPADQRNNYEYKNLLGDFNKTIRSIQGLEMVGPYSDEFELHHAFSKAYGFAKGAIENIVVGEKENNTELINKNKRILNSCNDVFDAHFWGESYKDKLKKYDNRLRIGRTVDEDIKEYYDLVEDAKLLSLEYAKAIKRGITDIEKEEFIKQFNLMFKREEELLMFVPRNMIDYTNLHWLKLDAERDPDKLLNEEEIKNK